MGGNVERHIVEDYSRGVGDSIPVSVASASSSESSSSDNDSSSSDSSTSSSSSSSDSTSSVTDDQFLIKSGDPIHLHPDSASSACITNGGGFAVIQQGLTLASINLVKIDVRNNNRPSASSKHHNPSLSASHPSSPLITNGTNVLVRYVLSSERSERGREQQPAGATTRNF